MRATLELPDAVQTPAAGDYTHCTLQVLSGQLPDIVEDEAVTDVIDGIAAIEAREGLISGETLAASSAVCSGGTTVPG